MFSVVNETRNSLDQAENDEIIVLEVAQLVECLKNTKSC